MDLLPGFSKAWKGTSLTPNLFCTENKITQHKCQDAQAYSLLYQNGHKMKEQRIFTLCQTSTCNIRRLIP